MMEQLQLTQEWDKTFPQSDKVNHSKITFHNRYGITLAPDMYTPKNASGKLPALAVCGPFGAVKEQCSGLYAQTMNELRTKKYRSGEYSRVGGCVPLPVPEDAPFFVKDYSEYYKGRCYHARSLNSNDGWNSIGCQSFMNQPILQYSNEIRSAVLIMHGDKAHSYYFGKDAYENMIRDSKYTENKEFLSIPGAVHTDLYDNLDVIPFEKLDDFFAKYLK